MYQESVSNIFGMFTPTTLWSGYVYSKKSRCYFASFRIPPHRFVQHPWLSGTSYRYLLVLSDFWIDLVPCVKMGAFTSI